MKVNCVTILVVEATTSKRSRKWNNMRLITLCLPILVLTMRDLHFNMFKWNNQGQAYTTKTLNVVVQIAQLLLESTLLGLSLALCFCILSLVDLINYFSYYSSLCSSGFLLLLSEELWVSGFLLLLSEELWVSFIESVCRLSSYCYQCVCTESRAVELTQLLGPVAIQKPVFWWLELSQLPLFQLER